MSDPIEDQPEQPGEPDVNPSGPPVNPFPPPPPPQPAASMDANGYSVLSTNWGGMALNVPLVMQNVPLEIEPTWANVFAIQLQTEITSPGTLTVNFRNVTALLSDQPIL